MKPRITPADALLVAQLDCERAANRLAKLLERLRKQEVKRP